MSISYDMIEGTELPIFDGLFCNNVIYEFKFRRVIKENSSSQKQALLSKVSHSVSEQYTPSAVCTLYETIYENGLKLECGEGAYGGIGFVCLSTINKEVIFLACFEESNPFIHAKCKNDCIRAINNLGEVWTFSFGVDELPSIYISAPNSYDDYDSDEA